MELHLKRTEKIKVEKFLLWGSRRFLVSWDKWECPDCSCAPHAFCVNVPPYAHAIGLPDKYTCLIGGKGCQSSMLTYKTGTNRGCNCCVGVLGKFLDQSAIKNRHFAVLRVHVQQLWTSQSRNTCNKRHIFSINNYSVSIFVNTLTEGCLQPVTAILQCFAFCVVKNITVCSNANTGSQKT